MANRACPDRPGGIARLAERPACVLCGRCLEVCPLFGVTGREELSPRAKFFLAQTLAGSPGALSEKTALELAGKCLSCGKCEQACPLGLCAPELLADWRARLPGLDAKLWGTWVEQAGVLWPVMTALARFSTRFSLPERLGTMAAGLAAMDAGTAPEPWLAPVRFDPCGAGSKAVLFPGCVARHARPEWTRKAEALLAALGFESVPAPEFSCCGCTLGHAGLKDAQEALQRANIEVWRQAGRPLLVTFCATCRCGLNAYAGRDLGWAPGEAEAWRRAQTPLSGPAARAVYKVLAEAPEKVYYHAPCHGAGGGHDRAFLEASLGKRLAAPTRRDLCCGFGGALKLSAPELSDRVARRCVEFYGPRPGEAILSGCSGCVVQLRAAANPDVGVGHWLDILRM